MKEAKAYRDWMLGCMPQRIAALLRYFGFDRRSLPPRELLRQLGAKIAEALPEEQFSQPGERDEWTPPEDEPSPQLTDEGYALAADMGLLLAQLLIDALGDRIRWEIVRKPKRDVNYNLPVLAPFDGMEWEPLRASIGTAYSILCGRRTGDTWAEALDGLIEDAGKQ